MRNLREPTEASVLPLITRKHLKLPIYNHEDPNICCALRLVLAISLSIGSLGASSSHGQIAPYVPVGACFRVAMVDSFEPATFASRSTHIVGAFVSSDSMQVRLLVRGSDTRANEASECHCTCG